MKLPRAGLVFVAVLAVYLITFSYRPTTDTQLNSIQTRQLALHGNVDLARYEPRGGFYVEREGHVYSIYGIGISLVALPFYAVLVPLHTSEATLQEIVACTVGAAAFVLVLLLLLKRFPRWLAIPGAIVFGFGTTIWTTATTALWQHGPVVALEALALIGVLSDGNWSPLLAGLAFGAAGFMRLPVFLVAGVFFLFFASQGRRPLTRYIFGLAPFLVARFVENRWIWGSWIRTGYSYEPETFTVNHLGSGLWGELFGWRRGLFVYSPIFVLAILGTALLLLTSRSREGRIYLFCAFSALGLMIVNAAHTVWWGGEGQFGYRYLIDVVPFLVLPCVAAAHRWRWAARMGALLGGFSIVFMAAGSVPDTYAWDTSYPQNALALSPLSHALRRASQDPIAVLWRLALVLVLLIFVWITSGQSRQETAFETYPI